MAGTRLHPKNFKSVAAGGTLVSKDVMKDGVSVKIEPVLLEEIQSLSPEPVEIYGLGNKISGKAILVGASLDDLALQMNATNSSGITLNATPTQPAVLTRYDVGWDVALPTNADNDLETWKVTNVTFTGAIDAAFKQGEAWYLPVEWRSMDDSVLTIVQS